MEEDDVGKGAQIGDQPVSREGFGKMLYGCEHYRKRCKLRAPCCDEVFTCRHCHNEPSLSNPKERHELVHHDVKQVVCSVCETEQQVAGICAKCGVKFTTKNQFHCNDCGICRVGGCENFFHCQKCGSCYAVDLRDNDVCVENSMKNHRPICYEVWAYNVYGLLERDDSPEPLKYRCPVCNKSMLNMSRTWETLDQEVPILCNDCNNTSNAKRHVIGHKCRHCNSYNTSNLATGQNRQ